MSGYSLHHDDGQCYFENWTAVISGLVIFGVIFAVIIVWVVDMCSRTSCNDESVTKAELWRSRSKIIDRAEEGNFVTYDTFSTNLCLKDVAGPGMRLHFNFQAFFIIWPFFCGLVWVALACFHNELFILGTRRFGTPRHNCILVAWGYETQQRLMWTKVLFLAVVYVGSFISFLWFSVRQLRIYNEMDAQEKTMKDFAVEIKGLPELPGDKKDLEGDLKKAVLAATKMSEKDVIGVSIAWNYSDEKHQEIVTNACNRDLNWRGIQWDLEQTGKASGDKEVEEMVKHEAEKVGNTDHMTDMGAMRTWMYNKEKGVLGPDEDEFSEEAVITVLKELKSSDSAFVVFSTEALKEKALEMGKMEFDASAYGFEKKELTFEKVCQEPANVNWHNFVDSDPSSVMLGFLKGFFKCYVPALLIWFFGFYVPYAWSLYNFNYDNGAELPGYFSLVFTIIVCGGNATMYVVCDMVCDIIGFRYKDTKQVTYMLMYLCACMINVFLDMVVTYFVAYKVMVGLDFRTYHGKRLADIDTFTEQFETYAMQRSLGENTYRYAWPSTFFLCFVLEPIVTILVPYQIGKLIIRTHKEIRGTTAEAYLMAFEFDLGRYADILLNVFLGVLIFYFPGGYIWTLFFAMAFSHTFIYCFDHWRVINVIPYVKIVSMEVDWWAQVMMAGCCAVILGCLVFKANCETYSGYCLQGMALIVPCCVIGTLHFIVHLLLLIYVVPKLAGNGGDAEEEDTRDYESVATDEARTWFSVNPVHCLRSQYIHQHSPHHCRLAYWGKEHLLKKNPEIGCYYEKEPAKAEAYDMRHSIIGAFSKKSVDKA
jgi:hypothetical protein